MKTFLKFLALVILLNISRYLFGGFIEGFTIMEPMHAPMSQFPDCFNTDFGGLDWVTSFFYNFMLWLCCAWLFYIAFPSVKGNFYSKSLKIYGICALLFISIAAIYMNHFTGGIQIFFRFAMLDAIIIFTIVALSNGFLFPLIFKKEINDHSSL